MLQWYVTIGCGIISFVWCFCTYHILNSFSFSTRVFHHHVFIHLFHYFLSFFFLLYFNIFFIAIHTKHKYASVARTHRYNMHAIPICALELLASLVGIYFVCYFHALLSLTIHTYERSAITNQFVDMCLSKTYLIIEDIKSTKCTF